MGAQDIHAETAQSQGGMSSYAVVAIPGPSLPADYAGFVFSKWLRTLRHGNELFKIIDARNYYNAYHKLISTILARPETVVRLALLSDDRDVALGFSVCRDNVLDYVYVHKDQRRNGIGTSLVPRTIDTITHVTNTGLSIWGSKYGHVKLKPFPEEEDP